MTRGFVVAPLFGHSRVKMAARILQRAAYLNADHRARVVLAGANEPRGRQSTLPALHPLADQET